jgi:hypothetical protein
MASSSNCAAERIMREWLMAIGRFRVIFDLTEACRIGLV